MNEPPNKWPPPPDVPAFPIHHHPDFPWICMAFGMATAGAMKDKDFDLARGMLDAFNRINGSNPHFKKMAQSNGLDSL